MSRARFDRALQHMEEQLREEAPPEPRWDAMERELLARVEQEARAEGDGGVGRPAASPRAAGSLGRFAMIAAAAAVALGVYAVTRPGSTPSAGGPARPAEVAMTHAGGEAQARGETDLTALRPGDVVDAAGEAVVFSHAGVVQWTLEPGGRAMIREVGGPVPRYVVALERGAMRAEVTPRDPAADPVEVFVVEVERTRVAVRGTIFTVSRVHDQVEVEVERGAVAVGPTDAGLAEPLLLRAPARGAFSFDGAPAGVAAPPSTIAAVAPPPASVTAGPSRPRPPEPAPSARALPEPAQPAHPANPANPAHLEPAPALASPVFTPSSVQSTLAACFASRRPAGSPAVQTSIQSTLRLSVRPDGSVVSVRFDPPLKPELQACAHFLYAGRFAEGPRDLAIPIRIEE